MKNSVRCGHDVYCVNYEKLADYIMFMLASEESQLGGLASSSYIIPVYYKPITTQ